MRRVLLASALLVVPALLVAGSVTGLTSFTNGEVASATAVNDNFAALATAVDDNDARLDAIEAGGTGLQAAILRFQPGVIQVPSPGAATVQLVNGGNVASGALTFSASLGFALDVSACPSTIAAGGSCSVSVTMNDALPAGYRTGGINARSLTEGAVGVLFGTHVTTGDGTSGNPGASCAAIKASYSGKTDGPYWIDPDGGGPIGAFQTWCDMSTTNGGPWTLVYSSNTVDGTSFENGATSPAALLQSLTPNARMDGVYTGFPNTTAIRFACDANRDLVKDVDFYYSDPTQANAIYGLFKASTGDSTLAGNGSAANFRSRSFVDLISGASGTTGASLSWEESDADTGDFYIGTNSAGSYNTVCYTTGGIVTNCMGAHDSQNNMCQRVGPTSGYASARAGYWYVFVK